MSFSCNICNKEYKSYKSVWNHNSIFHPEQKIIIIRDDKKFRGYKCKQCNKKFTTKQSMIYHNDNTCKNKINEIYEVKKQVIELQKEVSESKINNTPINNQLINIIMDKNKVIEELKNPMINNKLIENKEKISESRTLVFNNTIITSRIKDNYINASQLCQASNKKFNDWICLDSTNELINELEKDIGILASQLIDTSNNFQQSSWIHPDLAIQLAQWIAPKFGLQVSKWIRTLFANDTTEINIKQLKEQEKEIQLKNQKIQLLQDQFLKKQQRKDYPMKNVIYMLTTEDNKKKRNYIIGKAKDLKNRLSSYNKTAEHEVVYYKECKNKENMNTIETMVLNKLKDYKEKANRDRFILPIEKDISFFTDIIDNCINFFN